MLFKKMKTTKYSFFSCLMQHCAASNKKKLIAPVLTSSIIIRLWHNVFQPDFSNIKFLGMVVSALLLLILMEGLFKTIKGKPVETIKTEKYKTFCKEQLTLFFSWFGLVLICQHYMPEEIENKTIMYGGPCVILLIIVSTIKYYKQQK